MTSALKRYSILVFAMAICHSTFAGKANKGFEKLKNSGLDLMEVQEYQMALEDLLQADSISRGDAIVEYSIGVCYLNSPFPTKALPYIEKSEVHGSHDPYLQYNFGRADHINHLFDDAIEHYNEFLTVLDDSYYDREEKQKEVKTFIAQCNSAKEIIKDTILIEITNLGEIVNTEYPEYVPVISADESTLFFTSRRPHEESTDIDEQDNQYFEDIYYSTNEHGKWTSPIRLNNNINTDEHDACIGVSADGQQLFMYKSRRSSSGIAGDIWVSHKDGDEWESPEKLGENVNTDGWEPSATISSDGKKLFFTSNREGGYGGTDIYEADLNSDGTWGEAYNLGPTVNTEYDEDAPFIHADNKTLYFSSNGKKSMGGYDIFVTEYDFKDKAWSDPVNIGYPINTASHDIYMVWNAARTRGYFATYREGAFGKQDLYVLERPYQDAHLVLLKGFVKDSLTHEPLAADIEIVDIETNEIVGEYVSNEIDGKYAVTIPHGRNYSITVNKKNYLFYSKNIEIPDTKDYKEIRENIGLQKIYTTEVDIDLALTTIDSTEIEIDRDIELAALAIHDTISTESEDEELELAVVEEIETKEVNDGITMTLNNIFFDTDKYELRPTSYPELQNVYKLLINYPELYVEIAGHTDDANTDKYNQILSERRALAVVQYLVDQGIDQERLVAVGYGESNHVADNDTEEGKQRNRRTELKLIKQSDVDNYSNRITGLNSMVIDNPEDEEGEVAESNTGEVSYFHYSTKTNAKPQVGQILSLKIHFMFDNHDYITDFSKDQVSKVVSLLEEHTELRLKIHAHADPFGDEIYNQELSEKRAETTSNYLISLGVDESRIEVATYGEEIVLLESDDEAENLVNRRVEFEVIN